MRSIIWHMAVVAILGLGLNSSMAADAPVVLDPLIPAVMPSVATAATAANPIVPASGCLSGNCGQVVKSDCAPCNTKTVSVSASTECGACNSCGHKGFGLHRNGCGLLSGCNRLHGFGFGQCITPPGSGNAGTPGICVYGSYNLR